MNRLIASFLCSCVMFNLVGPQYPFEILSSETVSTIVKKQSIILSYCMLSTVPLSIMRNFMSPSPLGWGVSRKNSPYNRAKRTKTGRADDRISSSPAAGWTPVSPLNTVVDVFVQVLPVIRPSAACSAGPPGGVVSTITAVRLRMLLPVLPRANIDGNMMAVSSFAGKIQLR